MALTPQQIKKQSQSALRQWEKQWRQHAEQHSKYEMKSLDELEGSGMGKACLLIANGWSFEREIETIKKYQNNVDIVVCDKSLGHCLDNGIIPTYCIVCDANVNYELYMEKWKDKLDKTILLSNVCANPKWSGNGNWKDRYFFCVKDSINSEKIFQTISKCPNVIAAGTNVSNSMIIMMTQCDNQAIRNFFGYDKYLLIGFDYCWTSEGNYYAFDYEGRGKRYYMRHIYGRTRGGNLCYTSNNLAFSVQWIEQYISAFKLPVVNCSMDSVLSTGSPKDLATQMQYKTGFDRDYANEIIKKRREILAAKSKIDSELKEIATQRYYDYLASL